MKEEDNLIQATDPRGLPHCDQLHAAEEWEHVAICHQLTAELAKDEETIAGLRDLVMAYEEAHRDKLRLTRLLDIAMHGEKNAAPQASLCDLVPMAEFLRSRIEALETALAPFAKAEAHEDLDFPDDQTLVEMLTGDRITLGDIRRARSVLSEKPQESPKPSEGDIVGRE